MQFINILSGAVAYTIILLEVYSGAINGPLWWVLPGGLVLALLMALQMQLANPPNQQNSAPNPIFEIFRFLFILAAAFAASYLANYFGRDMIPCELLKTGGWTGPAEIAARCAI